MEIDAGLRTVHVGSRSSRRGNAFGEILMRKTRTGKVSRRRFIGTAAGAGMAAAAGRLPGSPAPFNEVVLAAQGAQAVAPAGGPAQDLTLVNGRIYTMDARNTVATTVTIRNGRFAIVGNGAPPADTQVINLGGRTVVPGLIEPHIHGVSLANRPGYHTILENTTSIREIQEALAARRKSVPEGQWITSMGGWHPNQWAEHRHPTLKELDDAVPDRPVLALRAFHGTVRDEQPRQEVFRRRRCGAAGPSGYQADQCLRHRRHRAGGSPVGGPSASALFHPAPAADVRGQEAEHTRRDGLFSECRTDRVARPGPLPHAGTAAPESDPLKSRSVPDVRLVACALHREGRALIRLQMNFLQNQTDPELPELKERLRNQFQFFGDDMMMTGGDRRMGGASWGRLPPGARRSGSSRRPDGATRTAPEIWRRSCKSSTRTRRSTRSSTSPACAGWSTSFPK